MKVMLWVFQIILAAYFLWHGWLYVAPPADLVAVMDAQFSPAFHIFIGVAEILGAAGLILPGLTRLMPGLTVWAAAGLLIVVGSAVFFHLFRGEIGSLVMLAILGILLSLVMYGRWKVVPLTGSSRKPLTFGQ